MDLMEIIENASSALPEGWEIRIGIEAGSAWVTLLDPEGDEVEYPSNNEFLAESVQDAVEQATFVSELRESQ